MRKPPRACDRGLLGLRIKSLREKAGLTQQALADAAGLHLGGVVKIELGCREPTFISACRLADAMGVSVDDFRGKKLGNK